MNRIFTLPGPTLVMKFGGTSVGTAAGHGPGGRNCTPNRVDWAGMIVITSALSTVTNILLDSAVRSALGETQVITANAANLKELHYTILEALVKNPLRFAQVKQEIDQCIAEFTNLCQAIAVLGEATPRALDAWLPWGSA